MPERDSSGVFVVVEDPPELLPSPLEGMRQLARCIEYPEEAKEADVEGRVDVQFIVDAHGRVVDPEVARGLGHGTDEEALRCVRQLRFTLGRLDGEAVWVKMSIPVTFGLR